MNYTYEGSVQSDLSLVKKFVEGILEKLNDMIDNEDTIFDIKLIINELIINGIFHGNNYEESKEVKVGIEIKNDKIIILVEDEGAGIHCNIRSYNPKELKCRGRGLILVEGLSDELILDRNQIKAVKYLS